MDIYSAENQVKKLLQYVSDMDEKRPNMYRKSKDRLKDLALNCVQVVKVISSILEEESLSDDYSGFESDESKDIKNAVSSIEAEVEKIRNFVDYQEPILNKNSDIDKKRQFSDYRAAFSYNYDYVNDDSVFKCYSLVKSWFSTRFLGKQPSYFHYNLDMFPGWIANIVSCYGYHKEVGTLDEFLSSFDSWAKSVRSGDSNYCLPYDIYLSYSSNFCSSLSSVVLWDVLCDSVFLNLVKSGYLSRDMIYDRCSKECPDVLNNYRDYAFDPSILLDCGWRYDK